MNLQIPMFDGWFIAGIETPQGQATYHLPLVWWDRFQCKELEQAPKWDGHTPNDVIQRVSSLRVREPAPRETRHLSAVRDKS